LTGETYVDRMREPEEYPELLPLAASYEEVREAARDWRVLSSSLNGQPHIRPYRQFPLEVDPPEHSKYRSIIGPVFERPRIVALEPEIRAVAHELIDQIHPGQPVEMVANLALPMVIRALAVVFGRSEDDVATWLSWGTQVFLLRDGRPDATHLQEYLARVIDESIAAPGDDVFGRIATASVDGRPLTRNEMIGLADLVLAGGRDTVVNLIAGAVWHLGSNEADRTRLAAEPDLIPIALEEFLRYLSPLPDIPRVAVHDVVVGETVVRAGQPGRLPFYPANFDPTVFNDPLQIRIDRQPNPHLAFGHGPHACIGAHLARLEGRVFLEELLTRAPDFGISQADVRWLDVPGGRVPHRFESLHLLVRD